ncbi:hypothetical protein E2C01_008416 [Portunus trituberculatus]|uniref:Uncharacterized protein n=1 Tax=Portunus trituberculatus TaxID=210409 RepID=A0A5B7D4L0_PORTR|nr:hypothetical protein [Portunus trituberculatus]
MTCVEGGRRSGWLDENTTVVMAGAPLMLVLSSSEQRQQQQHQLVSHGAGTRRHQSLTILPHPSFVTPPRLSPSHFSLASCYPRLPPSPSALQLPLPPSLPAAPRLPGQIRDSAEPGILEGWHLHASLTISCEQTLLLNHRPCRVGSLTLTLTQHHDTPAHHALSPTIHFLLLLLRRLNFHHHRF